VPPPHMSASATRSPPGKARPPQSGGRATGRSTRARALSTAELASLRIRGWPRLPQAVWEVFPHFAVQARLDKGTWVAIMWEKLPHSVGASQRPD
jgi:hypothetical protein